MPSSTRRRSRLLTIVSALTLALAVGIAPLLPTNSAVAATGDTISVAGRPAGEDGRPDGRTRFSYTVDPGQSVTDRFLVGNRGNQRQEFTVYATDAFNAADGAFSLLPTADEPSDVGAWTTFEDGDRRIRFALDPNEVRLVTFTIAFPAEATPGDHVGGIVASVVEEGAQVDVDRRVATQISARVSGELQPRLAVTSFEASHQGEWWNPFAGTMKIRYTVDNPGNVALAANVTMGVNTWFGIPATESRGGSIEELLPGSSASFEFDVAGIGQWLYLNPNIRLNPFVDDPDQAKALPLDPTLRDTVTWAVPWTIVIVIGIIGIIALLIWWKRRRDDAHARAWLEHTQNEARREAQREAGLVAAGRAPDNG